MYQIQRIWNSHVLTSNARPLHSLRYSRERSIQPDILDHVESYVIDFSKQCSSTPVSGLGHTNTQIHKRTLTNISCWMVSSVFFFYFFFGSQRGQESSSRHNSHGITVFQVLYGDVTLVTYSKKVKLYS